MAGNRDHPDRAFVLGLDGVPWDLIKRWIDAGELPHFERLLDEGAAGPLESTIPPATPLAWPSIATGVGADKHGVYGFKQLTSSYTPRMYTSSDVRQPELWKILSPALVGNVPMTYPAQRIDGKLFTGMMTPALDEGFAHPPALKTALLDRVPNYEIGLDWSEYHGRREEFLSELSDLVEKRRTAMELLMETADWRLFFFVYTAPDRLQHLVWEDAVLLEHYRHLDEILGDVMAYVARFEGALYVVSDHGFGPLSKLVAVNRVLENEGLLVRQRDRGVRSLLSKVGVSRDDVNGVLSKLGISDQFLLDHLPESLLRNVATRMPGDHQLFDVDYERTKAIMPGVRAIYVNRTDRFENGCVAPADRDSVKRAVKSVLSSVTDPDTGERPLEIYDGKELFPADDDSPDLVVGTAPGYGLTKSLEDEVILPSHGKAAGHRPEGILFAWGPSVEAGGRPPDASVVDVAPTLLHHLGEPVPADADGRVLAELFRSDSQPARRTPERRTYHDSAADAAADRDFDEVESRLRGLGYLE